MKAHAPAGFGGCVFLLSEEDAGESAPGRGSY